MATLYRKYRSQRFEDVIGQEPIITTLTNQIKSDRIGHAYLFTGSRGVGKTTCARIFARAVNCLHPVNGSPCGECEVCKRLAADGVDIIEMDAASNNGVDDARDIREKVKYLPVSCRYKVYIIDEVHMLTGGAFNALLKTIEEPPDHVIFILATTEPQKLPQTILSRCIRFDFRLVPTDILTKHICRVYDAEGIKYTADAAEEIARLGEGSVRDALSVADTLASAADCVTLDVVLSLTGAGDSAAIAELFDCTAARDAAGALTVLDKLVKNGRSMPAVCRQLIDFTRNVLVAKSVGRQKAEEHALINAAKATTDAIFAMADKYSMPDISRILTELGNAENGLKYSVNPRVFLETALVKLICIAERDDDILKRITALERNSSVLPTEQKKNKVEREDTRTPRAAGEYPEAERQKPTEPQLDGHTEQPPPPDDAYAAFSYEPPPVADDACEPPLDPPVRHDLPSAAPRKRRAAVPDPVGADEGEFGHLSATVDKQMELMGSVVRAVRKTATPAASRVMGLLAHVKKVREREDCIAIVAPDDVFLPLNDPSVVTVINAALDTMGIKKRMRVERTEDELRHDDIAKAVRLFGRDGVFTEPT